jgi:tetratricopeptide (TPR) repeat protein
MVSDWERGRHRPDAFYQELLCGLFEMAPHALGFRARLPWEAGVTPDDEERLTLAAREPSRVDPAVIESLATILAAQRRTEDVIGSAPLVGPVTAQLGAIERLVTGARGTPRRGLVDVAGQWAEYAGWLSLNTGATRDARRWFDRAAEWAAEADDTTLAATALSFKGHMAFLLGEMGPAIGLSRAARRDPSVWVGQRAYDAHQEGRALGVAGNTDESVRCLQEAEELAALTEEHRDGTPPWIYYYTAPFFLLERGWAYRYLGRDDAGPNDRAIDLLTAGLDGLGEERRSEWAAEYVYHLAVAYAQEGAPDRACAAAAEAADVARATDSARMSSQLRCLHARLTEKWPTHPAVADFGEALLSHRKNAS